MIASPISISYHFETNCTVFNLGDYLIDTRTIYYNQNYKLSIEDVEVGKWLMIAVKTDQPTSGTLQASVKTVPFQLTPTEALTKPVNPYYDLNQAFIFLYSPVYTPIQIQAEVDQKDLKMYDDDNDGQ